MAAATTDSKPGRLLLLVDEQKGRRFLVDTGSAYTILPFTSSSTPTGPALATASGAAIRAWGRRPVCIQAAGHRFWWQAVLADVAFPIVGADFLREYGLLVDPRGR